ncbi:galanin receptor type 3-like [Acanthaster planci]|uniref:Galanin receptor type 3-like n=1 Tax=Acanthaster planci TaxID=133434 RepID=A0A8B7Z9E0_ACAPL|nr:galanin receptor type 3-like [Acanthaster planci]
MTTAFNVITVCLTLLGNGTVIIVMLARRQEFSSFTNRLILHQSTIDAIAGVVFFFHRLVKSSNLKVSEENNFLDHLVCRCFDKDTLLWWAYVASTYNLVFISLERFLATCHPIKHRNMLNARKLKIAIGTSWALGFAFALPTLFQMKPSGGRCQPVALGRAVRTLVGSFSVLNQFLVPVGVMIFAYGHIFIKLKTGHGHHSRANAEQDRRSRAKKNVLMTVLMTSVLFVVCWTPSACGYIIITISDSTGRAASQSVYLAVTTLTACNMFVNPIVLFLVYKHFRDQLKDLVLKRLRRNQVHSEQDPPGTALSSKQTNSMEAV